jgi:hypothetical protein
MKKYAAFTATLLVPVLLLAADRLNVRSGLWEITADSDMQGMALVPPEVLEKMSPDQRAKMAAILAGQAPGGHLHTSKECVTEKDLEKPFESQAQENCQTTVVKTTSTMQEANIICSGEHPGTGKLHIDTPTPETMHGVVEIKVGEGAGAMTIKTRLAGKWLGTSCQGAQQQN